MIINKYSDISRDDSGLRPYQQQAKKEIFESWDEVDNVMFQMPTGTGKTRLFTSIISDINNYSLLRKESVKILIIAHRTELIEQIHEHLETYKVPHSKIVGGQEKNYKKPVFVASIQTITNARNIEMAKKLKVQFIIIDEAHHALAASYKKLWKMYPDAKRLGVTATPWRMNHQSFRPLFNKLILSMPIKDFIKQQYLSPYKYFSLRGDSTIQKTIDGIELDRFGEYKESSMEEKMDIGSIRAQLLESYLTFAKGKRGIIYAININHARHICKEYENAGYKAVSIDSKTPGDVRKELVEKFKKGDKIDIIVNVDIFSEGFDCPDIEFIQLARPTRSLVKYLQQVGRGLRPTNNKEHCIILDNVGMYSRFNLPDARRHWRYHFLGRKVDEGPSVTSLNKSSRQRSVDLSEGTEDMELIQDISEEMELTTDVMDLTPSDNHNDAFVPGINDFFPLWGITLGKTTWKQAKDMGLLVEVWKNGPARTSRVGKVDLWDHNGDGVFTSIHWAKFDMTDFISSWKQMGFSWENSYDDWLDVFKKFNYRIEVKKHPIISIFKGEKSLEARFEALSTDGNLLFDLNFDFGDNGYYTSSPKSLYSINIKYKGPIHIDEEIISLDNKKYNLIEPAKLDAKDFSFRKIGQCPVKDILKPLDNGIILGWTTVKEAISLGGKYESFSQGYNNVNLNGRAYWDYSGDGIINSITIEKYDEMPFNWSSIGLSFSMSYNQWIQWLERNGFSLNIKEEPKEGKIFRAKIEAEDVCHRLKLSLDFNYGKGSTVTDNCTLYSIAVNRKRIVTSTTDYTPYLPIDDVIIGQTKLDELPGKDIKLFNNSGQGGKGNHSFFFDKHNIVDSIAISDGSLPIEWEGTDYYGQMTFNKWIRFFNERGFIITKNDPINAPEETYPDLTAVHPPTGLSVQITFNRPINATIDGNLPDVFLVIYIRLV